MTQTVSLKDVFGNSLSFFTQWDMGQKIIIEGLNQLGVSASLPPTFYFANEKSKESLTVQSQQVSNAWEVIVPNILLQDALLLQVYTYINKNSSEGKTLFQWNIPVTPRAKPIEYQYEENTETFYDLVGQIIPFSSSQPTDKLWRLWLKDNGTIADYLNT